MQFSEVPKKSSQLSEACVCLKNDHLSDGQRIFLRILHLHESRRLPIDFVLNNSRDNAHLLTTCRETFAQRFSEILDKRDSDAEIFDGLCCASLWSEWSVLSQFEVKREFVSFLERKSSEQDAVRKVQCHAIYTKK